MTTKISKSDARVGDWLEVYGIHGETPRSGEIVEILGEPGHVRFRVRWNEHHESIVFPTDGVHVVRPDQQGQSV